MKTNKLIIVIMTTLFFLGFILGTFSGILYTTLHDIKTRGEANQSFIEEYIQNNPTEIPQQNNKTEEIYLSNKDSKELNPQEITANDTYLLCINNETIKIEEYAVSFVENYLKDNEKILSILNTKTNIMHLITKDETESYIYITSVEYRKNNTQNHLNENLLANYEIDLKTKIITKY